MAGNVESPGNRLPFNAEAKPCWRPRAAVDGLADCGSRAASGRDGLGAAGDGGTPDPAVASRPGGVGVVAHARPGQPGAGRIAPIRTPAAL